MKVPKLLSAFAFCALAAAPLLEAASIPLVPENATWRYRLGTSEASNPRGAWREPAFVLDGTWLSGAMPMGYAEVVNTTLPSSSSANYLSVYLRYTFVVTNPASFSDLTLTMSVDDGVVAWINGQEVSRVNVPGGDLAFNATASVADETRGANAFVTNASSILVEGTNVLAVHLFNGNLTSSDIYVNASLLGTFDDVPPVIVSRTPAAGETVREFNAVQVSFSEDVVGVDAADLLINNVPATEVLAASPGIYTFQFPSPATGMVTVAFAPGNGITDNAIPANAFEGDEWTVIYDPNAVIQPFLITEFLASNSGNESNSIRDEDGDSSDWIEIFNPSVAAGDLGGWYLTDRTNNLTQWRVPDGTTVPARGYLIIFASSKNRTNPAGRLHTNFQLNNSGEYLALVDPGGNVVSEFAPVYPEQSQDVSYGRDRAVPDIVGYFVTPTPGADNSVAGSSFSPEVRFSHASRTFVEPFELTLSVDDTNSEIRYTLVAAAQNFTTATNIPTATSTLYTGPINITNTVQVRARSFPKTAGRFPSPPKTQSYLAVNPGIADFTSTLPIVVIHTLGTAGLSGGFPTPDNSVVVATFDNTGGQAALLGTPQLVKRAGINLRGSSTQGHAKGSYALELWDEFNEDEDAEFLGLPPESDWVLYAPNIYDPTGLHNPLMHEMARGTGHYASRTRFVEVFFKNGAGALTANLSASGTAMGDYVGLYVLEEKVKRNAERVDIDRLEVENTTPPSVTGGYLVKIDRVDANERTFVGGGQTYVYQDPDGLEMVTASRSAQANYLTSYLNLFNATLQGANLTNGTGTNHYSFYLDIPPSLDHHIVNVVTMNVDAYRLSGYFYKPRNGKFTFGPVWDVDRGLGTSARGGDWRAFNPRAWMASNPLGASDYGTDFFQGSTPPAWMARLFSDLDFWQQWIDRYQDLRTSVLETNRLVALVDSMADEIRPLWDRNQRRWQGTGNADPMPRAGVTRTPNSDYTYTFPTPGTFQGEIDFQKQWLVEHIHFMDTNLLNRPSLITPPGEIGIGTMISLVDNSGKSGTKMFYTLDGSDPRGRLGGISANAIEYTGPITVTGNVRIRARAMNPNHRNLTGAIGGSRNPIVSSTWSGDIAGTYYTEIPALRITEIMFNPPQTPGVDTDDSDNFEYLELKNIGSTTLNLTGFQFTNGIRFNFTGAAVTNLAPGEYVLIVGNLNGFITRYGPRDNIAGVFDGNLSNGGERLSLVGPRFEPILDFEYDDAWYATADGLGFSLTIVDDEAPRESWGTKAAWRIGRDENGSPGMDDGGPREFPAVFVNEALTHTDPPQVDTIELWNAGAAEADIGGWFLTDDLDEPKKYVIPQGTIIPGGGFALFNETDHFNAGGNGFGLSSAGDSIYLFSGDGVNLTGYFQGFDFGGSPNGATFGRYVTSEGLEHFVEQAASSLGAANGLPRVGPVVISEIMYHPPEVFLGNLLVDNTPDEFVEIQNITSMPVDLFDPANPANRWRLRGGVEFDLPGGVTLPANGFALFVNFDPIDTVALEAFRAKYGVPPGVPVFGPYTGNLSNGGEDVRLTRPDAPDLDGSVPYILVERIDYRDLPPWPVAADGPGASLHRMAAMAYGNDPTNWAAARPSPGSVYEGGDGPTIIQQPHDITIVEAMTTNLSVIVSSPTPVSFQWRFNDQVIPGATNSTLNFDSIKVTDAGTYSVTVFNGGGVAASGPVTVIVRALPIITEQPASHKGPPGTNVTFRVSAVGTGTITYQWRFNGTNIPGATGQELHVNDAQLFTDAGFYDAVVTDEVGSLVTETASLIILIRPTIVSQPIPISVVQGGTAVFSVVAEPDHPSNPLKYRWLRNNVTYLVDAGPVLVFEDVQTNYLFRVAITNLAGSVASPNVQLTMLPDGDGDGMPDEYETANGFNPAVADGLGDADGDGISNRDEYNAGTNPNDAADFFKLEPLALDPGPGAVLQFNAPSNHGFTIQYRDSLSNTGWANLYQIHPARSNRVMRIVDPVTGDSRYYRVTTPQVP